MQTDARRDTYYATGATETAPVISERKAKAGITGQNLRYMLFGGIAAVVVLFAVIYLWSFA